MHHEYPLAFLRRALHFKGKWPHLPRKRMIRMHAIVYIKHGAGEIMIDQVRYPISGNQFFLLTPGMEVMEKFAAGKGLEAHYLAFTLMRSTRKQRQWTVREYEQPHLPDGGEVRIADRARMDSLVGQLYDDGMEDAGLLRWKRQFALTEMLYILLREGAADDEQSRILMMKRCAAYMDWHYAENIRMDKLAQLYGLYPSAFSRLFKQAIGVSPMDYLMHVRMEAAKTMLRGTTFRLREVAQQAGFCDEYYFSRMFKKAVGVSPSVYNRSRSGASSDNARSARTLEPIDVAVTYVDEADHLIALGLLPAAVPDDHRLDDTEATIPYLKRYIGHLPRIGCERTLDRTRLDKLQPNLIIAGWFLRSWGITWLDEVARTHYYIWEVDWRNIHRELAITLGRESLAERNIERFDRLVRNARDRMYRALIRRRFAFLEMTRDGIRISPYTSNGGWLLFQQLGLTPSPEVSLNRWDHFIEPAEAAAIQADFIIVGKRSGSQFVYESFMREPGIRRIRSKLLEVPRYPWGKGGPIAFVQGVKHILSTFERIHK
ncbi:helix-turn-helix domain-containing protein [Paenibacillaceae bacterium WGS1546]|uniref:helix-turn-helix domain-containing protein n=1 Tax=Cohnella sp. WGS1546 TaxID=3366810 RepID=UPI00372D7E1A